MKKVFEMVFTNMVVLAERYLLKKQMGLKNMKYLVQQP
jgi:hypothetical protein